MYLTNWISAHSAAIEKVWVGLIPTCHVVGGGCRTTTSPRSQNDNNATYSPNCADIATAQ
jgi:hypothetical protein